MLVKASRRLEKRIAQISSSDEPQQYLPECTLYNPDNEFRYRVRSVKSFNIIQNFDTDYMDQMTLIIEVTPEEYKALVKNFTGLKCTIVLHPVDRQLNIMFDHDPIIIETIVLIPDMEDMDKNVGSHFVQEEDGARKSYQREMFGPLELQLVEPMTYDFRHIQVCATFDNTTVEPVLHWAGKQFGAEYCKIKTPDNPLSYSNLIIPPMKDAATLLPFLQQRYGIYAKGLGYYFTNETFYSYPLYDSSTDGGIESSMVHVISAPNSNYTGKINHLYMEKDLWILSTGFKSKTLNTASSENYGTAVAAIKADTMRDQEVTHGGDGSVVRNDNDMVVIQQHNSGGRTNKSMMNIKYSTSTANIYVQTSDMAKNDGTYAAFAWASAIPKAFYPGQKILVHVDGADSAYNVQSGIILSVSYNSVAMKDSGLTKPTLRFIATITAKLESDYTSEEGYQFS